MKPVHSQKRPAFQSLVAGICIGLFSLWIPLLRDLHWESAALAAVTSSLYAALIATRGVPTTQLLLRNLSLLAGWGLPLTIFAVATDCFSLHGAAFWMFGPLPSMLLGWSVGRLIFRMRIRKPFLISLLILLLIAIVPSVIELLSFPQLYFFNHVWGYWPGPIYDELVWFDSRMPIFRTLTLLWVAVLWAIPTLFTDRVALGVTVMGTFALLFSYAHLDDWGVILPEEQLQQTLNNLHETQHFQIWYSDGALAPEDVQKIGETHETHLKEIADVLDISLETYREQPIHSYIYQSVDQKKRMTGAGNTSYVPVWMQQDQTHIAKEHLEKVLRHELVHIIAKQFGNWFGASTSIALVEGLAVALDSNRYRSGTDQLVAARQELPGNDELRELFTPVGFYLRSGPISYLITGSFVRYLIHNYPVEMFKQAYFTGDMHDSYAPYTFDELAGAWRGHLAFIETDSLDRQRAEQVFSTPSVFEKPCPRVEKKQDLKNRIGWLHTPEAGPESAC